MFRTLAAAALALATLAGSALAQTPKLTLRFSVGANDSATDGMAAGIKAMKNISSSGPTATSRSGCSGTRWAARSRSRSR